MLWWSLWCVGGVAMFVCLWFYPHCVLVVQLLLHGGGGIFFGCWWCGPFHVVMVRSLLFVGGAVVVVF